METGALPIGEIMKIRRIMYLRHLVTRDKNEMIYQFFMTQWINPTKGDWTETIKDDLKDYNISEDLDEIKKKSKSSTKHYLKKIGREKTLSQLLLQKGKHSKMKNLEYTELKIQDYFLLPGIRVDQARNIFKFRTRMAPMGENFRENKENVICPLCGEAPDNQEHFFNCEKLREKIDMRGFDMKDIYSNNITLETAETITKMIEIRKKLLETSQNKNNQPMRPRCTLLGVLLVMQIRNCMYY